MAADAWEATDLRWPSQIPLPPPLWGGLQKLEPYRPLADTWVVLLHSEIGQAVEHKIVGEVVQEEIVWLGFSGLGEAGVTRARRGK